MLNLCTCSSHTPSVHSRAVRYDPTRTTGLRNAFVRDMDKRFSRIMAAIVSKIVAGDCFGLKDQVHRITLLSGEFNFQTTSDKVQSFMDWLDDLVEKDLLMVDFAAKQLGTGVNAAWTNKYITDSYFRGAQRARYDLKTAGYKVPDWQSTGGLSGAMQVPQHLDRVGVLYTRTFSDLKGITAAMDTQVSKVLAQGLIDGKGQMEIARILRKTITGEGPETLGITDSLGRYIPAKRRAEMLARTEIIRAHHVGTVQEYRNWGAANVKVKAEWVTAGYNVCPDCAQLEGKVFTIDQIETMIPRHPNCRCSTIPVIIENNTGEQ